MTKQARENVIPIRLNDAELAAIDEQATARGVDRSAYIRWKLCGTALPTRQDPRPKGLEVWHEVSRLANNLNQLAKLPSPQAGKFADYAAGLEQWIAEGLAQGVEPKIDLAALRDHGGRLNALTADANSKKHVTPEMAEAAKDCALFAWQILRAGLVQLGWIEPNAGA